MYVFDITKQQQSESEWNIFKSNDFLIKICSVFFSMCKYKCNSFVRIWRILKIHTKSIEIALIINVYTKNFMYSMHVNIYTCDTVSSVQMY